MSLRWNTCKLLSPEGQRGIPIEFHFLSGRELYDSTILSADRHHSSAGEWVVHGDHRWYTVAVVTRPVYALPQELCLSFECFTKKESTAWATTIGPPIDD